MELRFSFLKHFKGKALKMHASRSLKFSSRFVFARLMAFPSSVVSLIFEIPSVSSAPLALGAAMPVR